VKRKTLTTAAKAVVASQYDHPDCHFVEMTLVNRDALDELDDVLRKERSRLRREREVAHRRLKELRDAVDEALDYLEKVNMDVADRLRDAAGKVLRGH
jgi:hypothetical protein